MNTCQSFPARAESLELREVLAPFSPETQHRLQQLANIRQWRGGHVVLQAGAIVGSVLVVLEGRLRVTAITSEGEEVFFRWFTPGEYAGVGSALGGVPFVPDATAACDLRCAQFERSQFLQILASDGAAALLMAQHISRYAHEMTRLVIAKTESKLTGRVFAVLVRLARHNSAAGPRGEMILLLAQSELARAVGASRQRVNIELSKLERAGCIRLGYKHVVLLDPAFHQPAPSLR